MTRSSLLTLWNSRSRLAVFAGVLALLVGVLRLCRDDLTVQSTGIVYSNSFSNDVDYDLDTLQYMYDLHKGSAHIRSVIEKPRKVHEFWRCLLPVPSYITRNASWVKNGRLYLYSAYYDDRPNSLYPNHHSIQVLSLSFRSMNLSHPLYCNIFDIKTNRYLVVEGTVREIWQRAWDPRDFFYIPNLITCPVPSYFATTDKFTISLTNAPCQAEKAAIAVERMPLQSRSKRDVVVCVKGLDFLEDISERMAEWIEFQYLLGADKITVYLYHVTSQTEKLLQYYVNKGKLEVISLTLPGGSPNQPYTRSKFIWRNRQQKRRHELIPYNDCYYRHLYTHKYILIADIDEIVVPLVDNNWANMLRSIEAKTDSDRITSISIPNVFKFPSSTFDETVPEHLFMLRNRRRSRLTSRPGDYGKSFISTKTVATVFNHFALHRLSEGAIPTIHVKEDIAIKLHYKETCPIESGKECAMLEKVTTDDTSLDRFAQNITDRVFSTLQQLQSD